MPQDTLSQEPQYGEKKKVADLKRQAPVPRAGSPQQPQSPTSPGQPQPTPSVQSVGTNEFGPALEKLNPRQQRSFYWANQLVNEAQHPGAGKQLLEWAEIAQDYLQKVFGADNG